MNPLKQVYLLLFGRMTEQDVWYINRRELKSPKFSDYIHLWNMFMSVIGLLIFLKLIFNELLRG